MEIRTNVSKSGTLYLPIEIREPFGRTIRIIPDALAAVLFPDEADYQDVLDSLDVIVSEIKHRITLRDRVSSLGIPSQREG